MSDDKQQLFRKEALEERTTERELDSLMTVVSSKTWLTLTTFSGLAVLFLIWTFIGVIPDEVPGTAILMYEDGNFTIEASHEAQVQQILVKPGQLVKEGEVLIELKSPKLLLQIANLSQTKDMLERHLNDYGTFYTTGSTASRQALTTAIHKDQANIDRIDNELVALNKDYQRKKSLYERQILAEPPVLETKEKINQKIAEKEHSETQILEHEAQLKKLGDITQRQQYENELNKVNREISELELQKERLTVRAPHSGRILTVPILPKEWVERGHLLVWGERRSTDDHDHILYGYFTSSKDQRIRPGQLAQVRLSNVDYKRYGDLLAHVVDVWKFPVSSHELFKVVGNQNIVNFLTQQGGEAAVQVVLRPVRNLNTPTGYAWTSEKGLPEPLESGSIGNVKVAISTRRPIEFVFPMFRDIRDSISISRKKYGPAE